MSWSDLQGPVLGGLAGLVVLWMGWVAFVRKSK